MFRNRFYINIFHRQCNNAYRYIQIHQVTTTARKVFTLKLVLVLGMPYYAGTWVLILFFWRYGWCVEEGENKRLPGSRRLGTFCWVIFDFMNYFVFRLDFRKNCFIIFLYSDRCVFFSYFFFNFSFIFSILNDPRSHLQKKKKILIQIRITILK